MTEMQRALHGRLPKLWAQPCSLLHFLFDFSFLKLYQRHRVLPRENLRWSEKLLFFQFVAFQNYINKNKTKIKVKKKKHPKKTKQNKKL